MKLFRWERKVGALQMENLWRGGWSPYGGTKQREDSGCHEIKAMQVLQQQGGTLSRVNWATRLQRWRSALRGCRKAYWWREDEGERWWSCRAELTRVIVYHSPIPWKQVITSSAASWCLQQLASEWDTPIVSYCMNIMLWETDGVKVVVRERCFMLRMTSTACTLPCAHLWHGIKRWVSQRRSLSAAPTQTR